MEHEQNDGGEIADIIGQDTDTQMGEQLVNAARESSKRGARRVQQSKLANPIAASYGSPSFRLPEREGKWINERSKKVTRRMAFVTFPMLTVDGTPNGLELETSIYADEMHDAEGDYLSFRISLPRGIGASRENPLAQGYLNDWHQIVLDSYDEWARKIEASAPVRSQRAQNGPRLVKRVKVDSK